MAGLKSVNVSVDLDGVTASFSPCMRAVREPPLHFHLARDKGRAQRTDYLGF